MIHTTTIPRPVLGALCCLIVAVPFLVTTFPPITDLPQQSAQIRLFVETIQDPAASPYKIQWFTPYSLSYAILGACWALFGPKNAGRMAMLAIALLWVLAMHLTAYRRSRSPAAAVLGSLFVFNHIVYWGFYSFAVGWPVFLLWFSITTEQPEREVSAREAFKWVGAAILLYMSHVLWLVAGVAWLAVSSVVFRVPIRYLLYRFLYVAPLVVAVLIWYPMLTGSAMATPPLWGTTPLDRLHIFWLADAALGGLQGRVELIVLGAVCAWILLALWTNRANLGEMIDWELLLAAGVFFAFALLLPDKFMNTIRFGQRWVPAAMIMLVLGLPTPSVRPVVRQVAALALLTVFCAVTTSTWLLFERKELSGLEAALSALPASPRVLGLDTVRKSELIKGYPFLHFDYAIVNGTERIHKATEAEPLLTPVTHSGRWRLYRVSPSKQ
ncbi:MAG: hypothetical protein P8182_12435 [Deltaproteobacteria bacterium]